jgi:uncharacterized protein YqeY
MSIRDEISRDTKEAMKARKREETNALRMLSAALKNAEIEKSQALDEAEEQAVLRRQVKQREESAEAYRKAGRIEQAEAEEREAEIARRYLPAPLSEEEMAGIADRAIAETGATSMREMGAVMGRATALAGGRADGRLLSRMVRERLQG